METAFKHGRPDSSSHLRILDNAPRKGKGRDCGHEPKETEDAAKDAR
jgi:hypothetical protein